jgi:hypothetical protein
VPDRRLSTDFRIDLPDPWSKPSAAFVREFRAYYRKLTGQRAELRAVREDARGRIAVALFTTLDPMAPGETLEQAYAQVTDGGGGELAEPQYVQVDGTTALVFDERVTEGGGPPSENRLLLCLRGDQLVALNFSTVDATALGPAKAEIDQMIDSLRWRTS